MEQDRRAEVVGQVADQADLPAVADQFAGQLAEVHAEHVAFDQPQRAVFARGGLQRRVQVAVEFDRGECAVLPQQREGQRALAGADLDDGVAGLRVRRLHDLVDDPAVVEEVLAEVFLGGFAEGGRAHAGIRLRAKRAQVRIAAYRLEGSALPLPASSSAVPWSTATRG